MEFLDIKAQYKLIKKNIDVAIKKVFKKGVFIGGQEVENFEKEIAKFCRIKYAIGVNSGTDALFVSLKALNIGPGDEVITSPFTFIATAEVIANCGAKPVFVDIKEDTFNIDPSKIEKALTKKTKAIIPVHLFGQMAEMVEIMKIAKKHKLYVIEDAAQAIGAKYKCEIRNPKPETPKENKFPTGQANSKFQILNSKKIWRMGGTIGDLGCFSFFPLKNLGAYGDGGMVITNNKKLAEKIRLLRNHGSSPEEKYLNLILGTNSRLDALQAAILRVKLKYLPKWSRERANKAFYYNKGLKRIGDIITPIIDSNKTHIFHQYTIRTEFRDELQKYLKENGIPTMIYYPLPLHLQPAFKYFGYKVGDFPAAEKVAKEVISLPTFPELKKKEQDLIVKKIKEFYAKEK